MSDKIGQIGVEINHLNDNLQRIAKALESINDKFKSVIDGSQSITIYGKVINK